MKKSELRNIIRRLIKEQTSNPNMRDVHSGPCQGFGGAHITRRMTIDGAVPQIGDVFIYLGKRRMVLKSDPVGQGIMGNNFQSCCNEYDFVGYTGPDCCSAVCGTQTSNNFQGSGFNQAFLLSNYPTAVGPQAMNGGCATNTGDFCCSNPNYFNMDPSACSGISTPTTYDCKQKGDHPKFGSKCVPVQGPQGQFATLQDCLDSGCEPLPSDQDLDKGFGFNPSPAILDKPSDIEKDIDIDDKEIREKKVVKFCWTCTGTKCQPTSWHYGKRPAGCDNRFKCSTKCKEFKDPNY
tara:strand:- start:1086 stop:1964 length:879 start_codon:yes stop_codon:yes gene_type:complete